MKGSPLIAATQSKDGRYVTGLEEIPGPQRTANIRTLFVISIKETVRELDTKKEMAAHKPRTLTLVY